MSEWKDQVERISRYHEGPHARSINQLSWVKDQFGPSVCQSPIEIGFLVAYVEWITNSSGYGRDGLEFCKTAGEFKLKFESIPEVKKIDITTVMRIDLICPQYPIENYTADFVLGRADYACKFVDDPSEEHGFRFEGEFLTKLPLIVVECDGHDFHERTKDQAQHDKARDRVFTAAGYRTLRFTGSEIHRNPIKCAVEVDLTFDALRKEAEKKL